MQEELIVAILIKYARELGYTWHYVVDDVPRVFFDAKVITIEKEDLILYHVLHEVAHILIGPSGKAVKSIAKHELLAEGVSIVVRDVLGFEPHAKDDGYLQSWLKKLKTTKTAFYQMYEGEITRHAKTIASRIRRESGTTVPFKGCKRSLAPSGAFIGGGRERNYRSGVRLCHSLPDGIQRCHGVTTEGHDAPERLLQRAHRLA